MQTKNGTEYYSLYEYLGYPAGPDLGEKINKVAIKAKQEYVTQYIEPMSCKNLMQSLGNNNF